MIFEDQKAAYYPFGYNHYVQKKQEMAQGAGDLRARLDAQEAAMIAELRAVPEAERHCLREIGTQEAYEDWQMRLALEDMAQCQAKAQELWERRCELWDEASEAMYEEAAIRWQEACLHWYDVYLETEPREENDENDPNT